MNCCNIVIIISVTVIIKITIFIPLVTKGPLGLQTKVENNSWND